MNFCPQCHRIIDASGTCDRCGNWSGSYPALSSGTHAAQPPELFDEGRLVYTAPLGSGGTADVWRCYDHSLGCEVAVKLLLPDLCRSPRLFGLLQQEASALASFRHPGLVRLYRRFWHGERFAMVLELLSGGDLEARRAAGAIPKAEAIEWTLQVLDALDAIHARGYAHRDLKLENVMLDGQGRARLADLGIRLDMRVDGDISSLGSGSGSPRTMSPEQLLAGHVDHRTDIYAAGLLLCELLTGSLPFPEDAPAFSPARQAPNLARVRAAAGREIADVVATALSVEPSRRYQRALAMREALADAAGQTGLGSRLRVGRDPSQVDIFVDHPGVSGVHCELHVLGDWIVVTDLDSTNGTRVDGTQLEPFVPHAASPHAAVTMGHNARYRIDELLAVAGSQR